MKRLFSNQTMIKRFMAFILLVALLFISPISINASNGLKFDDEGIKPLAVTVSYYNDVYSRGFAWTTMEPTDGILEIVAASSIDSIDWSKAKKVSAIRKVEDDNYYTYKAYVENLTEDTYFYRVGSRSSSVYSEIGKVTIDHDQSEINFIYATDSQDYNEEGFTAWKTLVEAAYQTMPEAQFFAMGGDIVNDSHSWGSHDLDQWIYAMDLPEANFMNSVFMPVAGNHDDWEESFANRYCIDYAGPTETGAYYSFDYGNIHFVGLNTNENAWGEAFQQQLEWLRNDLLSTDAQWKIVMVHKGPISTGDHSNDGDVEQVRTLILPIIAECEVDLVLQGHDHVYVRSRPYYYGKDENGKLYNGKTPNMEETIVTEVVDGNKITYSIDPAGTFFVTANYAGRKSYPPVDYDESVIFPAVNPYNGLYMSQQIKQQTFTTISIKDNTLKFNTYLFDGTEVELYDTYNVKKDTHLEVEELIKNLPDQVDIFDYVNVQEAYIKYKALVPNALKNMSEVLIQKIENLNNQLPSKDCAKAYEVASKINEITEVEASSDFINKIKDIKKLYLDLTDAQKEYVINYSKLAGFEAVYKDKLYAKAVTDMAYDESISDFEVYIAYNELTEEQKSMVDLNGRNISFTGSEEVNAGCSGNISSVYSIVAILSLGLSLVIFRLKLRRE